MRRSQGVRCRGAGDALGGGPAPDDWDGPGDDANTGRARRWRWGRRGGHQTASSGDSASASDPGTEHGPGRCHGHGHGQGHHGHGHHGHGHGWGRGRGLRHVPPFEGRSLNDIAPGESCRIFALHGRGAVRQRLMDIGLVPNATLTVVRSAPLNDPIEVRVGATLVSVRRAEAARIEVLDA
nr:FeoA family protein [Roseospira visakhapatnamensis]